MKQKVISFLDENRAVISLVSLAFTLSVVLASMYVTKYIVEMVTRDNIMIKERIEEHGYSIQSLAIKQAAHKESINDNKAKIRALGQN